MMIFKKILKLIKYLAKSIVWFFRWYFYWKYEYKRIKADPYYFYFKYWKAVDGYGNPIPPVSREEYASAMRLFNHFNKGRVGGKSARQRYHEYRSKKSGTEDEWFRPKSGESKG